MEIESTYDFVQSIKMQMSPGEFKGVKEKLFLIPSFHRAAFWYLIKAGNSASTAFEYSKNLYDFVRNNFIDFENAIEYIRCERMSLKQNNHDSQESPTGMKVN
jgi:hypothetical protein